MGNSRTSKRHQARIAEREAHALRLFLGGSKYHEIAEQIDGYADKTVAFRAVERAIMHRSAERAELAEHALTIMMERLDGLLVGHYGPATHGDVQSAAIVLKILDRQAKLQGLDTGTINIAVHTKSPIDVEIEQLAAALVARAREQGVDVPPMLEAGNS